VPSHLPSLSSTGKQAKGGVGYEREALSPDRFDYWKKGPFSYEKEVRKFLLSVDLKT